MLKNEMLESLKDVQEILKDCSELKEITNEQKYAMKDKFNTWINFEYCEDGGYIFLMSEENFKSFEYYLGMEYEKENIETKINSNGNILVIYSYDSERAGEIVESLSK